MQIFEMSLDISTVHILFVFPANECQKFGEMKEYVLQNRIIFSRKYTIENSMYNE